MTLFVHILGGAAGIVTGYIALYATKGAPLHRKAGALFVCAMLVMSLTGAALAALEGEAGSVIGGLLAGYLVTTALTTVRPPSAWLRRLNIAAALVGVTVGVGAMLLALQTVAAGKFVRNGVPVPMLLLFGTIALAASASDFRLLRSEGIEGRRRLVRHLWRMCFSLFIATGSFFLGQADEFPEPIRIMPLLTIAALLPLAILFYWLWRVRVRANFRSSSMTAADPLASLLLLERRPEANLQPSSKRRNS
jgi:uncharacterized membrane protein